MTRLPVETFEIPAAEIRRGYRSAIYFNRAKHIAEQDPERDLRAVTMQVFQKNDAVLCGMDEALAVLRVGSGRWLDDKYANELFDEYMHAKLKARSKGGDVRHIALEQMMMLEEELDGLWQSEFDRLHVAALNDGDLIEPWEPVMHIQGSYSAFAHLESPCLGVLARRTLVATNTSRVCSAANGKQVLFFADRFDHWSNQGGDGYAAHVGGASGFASDAMAAWWGEKGVGTMPHALIAFYGGDTVAATDAFRTAYPDARLIALVDFNNNCRRDAIACAEAFGPDLWGVRLDTSENMVDASISGTRMGDFKPTGVNPVLVESVRDGLDRHGHTNVKIIVSGGFNADKIRVFEHLDVPVDAYAVGSSLLQGQNDFTADIVAPVAKAGRWLRVSDRLQTVT